MFLTQSHVICSPKKTIRMLADKKGLILREIEDGTGAAIDAVVDHNGFRSGLRIWFGDLDEKHGPVAEIHPHGLKGHKVNLSFGSFSGEVINQIQKASQEDVQLARALVASIRADIEVEVPGQSPSEWCVTNGMFQMTAKVRNQDQSHADSAIISTCREVIVPMMAAMAELIGYDLIEEPIGDGNTPAFDGAILRSVVQRRERNPRNRLLCIRIHGEKCAVCGIAPRQRYGDAGSIIEIHHLEPVALLVTPRLYDPRADLVPLCPSCHRAVHTRRPIPLSIEEIREQMEACSG